MDAFKQSAHSTFSLRPIMMPQPFFNESLTVQTPNSTYDCDVVSPSSNDGIKLSLIRHSREFHAARKVQSSVGKTMMHMPMFIQYIFSGRCKPFGSRCVLFWHLALLACRPSGLSHSGLLLPFRALHQSHYFLCSYHSKLARWAHLHRQWRGSAPCQSNLRLHYHVLCGHWYRQRLLLWDCLSSYQPKLARWDHLHRQWRGLAPCQSNLRLHYHLLSGHWYRQRILLWDCLRRRQQNLDPCHKRCRGPRNFTLHVSPPQESCRSNSSSWQGKCGDSSQKDLTRSHRQNLIRRTRNQRTAIHQATVQADTWKILFGSNHRRSREPPLQAINGYH